ncbi:MAG: hypothetical protein JXB14_01015 [Candidatus Altiarchaeota archaeon]|nr:hypothetical protein [Candidatus Altiarchaeota archaeon]
MSDKEIEAYFKECVADNRIFFYTGGYANSVLLDEKYWDVVEPFEKFSVTCQGGVEEGYRFNKLMLDYVLRKKS